MSEIDLKRFFLEQVPMFEHFPADKVEEIIIGSRLATYEGNEAILETGDETTSIGIIISGHAEISVTDNTGSRAVISQLEPGDVFGIIALLTGDRLSADIIAGNRCFVLLIPQQVFNARILTNTKALGYLTRVLAERMRVMSSDPALAQTLAVSHSDDPYALALHSDTPGKVLVLNVGISQIHFGIYDTRESGADIHGIIDNADKQLAHVMVKVGTQQRHLEHKAFRLSDLFTVTREVTRLLGEAFTFHP